jgi:hypothetical protein
MMSLKKTKDLLELCREMGVLAIKIQEKDSVMKVVFHYEDPKEGDSMGFQPGIEVESEDPDDDDDDDEELDVAPAVVRSSDPVDEYTHPKLKTIGFR